jgi:hypothetical protein
MKSLKIIVRKKILYIEAQRPLETRRGLIFTYDLLLQIEMESKIDK